MTDQPKPVILLTCFPGGIREGDVIGCALAEDGRGLASHLSSNVDFSKHDMGLTSDWKHEHYAKVFPQGYELVWIDNPETDARWQAALVKNRALKKENENHADQQEG